MKKIFNWQIVLGLILIGLSALFYMIHYLIFRDAHHIFIYLIGDIAFVFIEVLLVTLVIHRLLSVREKKILLKKLNMVIGAFFSEAGTGLLKRFYSYEAKPREIADKLVGLDEWPNKKFIDIIAQMHGYSADINCCAADFEGLKTFLVSKRGFLLGLLENPNLLEHESFTDLLWAVFHLTEELDKRPSFPDAPSSDITHLHGDIKRAYNLLIAQWFYYMMHLKCDYPYLFSLAVRTNPFDANASVLVKQ